MVRLVSKQLPEGLQVAVPTEHDSSVALHKHKPYWHCLCLLLQSRFIVPSLHNLTKYWVWYTRYLRYTGYSNIKVPSITIISSTVTSYSTVMYYCNQLSVCVYNCHGQFYITVNFYFILLMLYFKSSVVTFLSFNLQCYNFISILCEIFNVTNLSTFSFNFAVLTFHPFSSRLHQIF